MTVPPPDAGAWSSWVAHLVEVVTGLADGASVTLTAASGSARPVRLRKARLGGFIPAKHESVSPWVRLERVEDHLKGFCVGAEALGGSFPLSPDEHDALHDLGWHQPPAGEGRELVRFWPDDVPQGPFLPRAEAERAASMVAATFRDVLTPGAEPPAVPG